MSERQRAPKMSAWGDLRRWKMLRALAAAHPLTVRQLGSKVGLSSTSSTQWHIEHLRSTGLIEHVSGWQLSDLGRAALAEEDEDTPELVYIMSTPQGLVLTRSGAKYFENLEAQQAGTA